jgi:hypothetical protein
MDLAYLWFFIVGVLFVGYFVLDGFDFGVGMSLPFLGKDEVSRRQVINTIGPSGTSTRPGSSSPAPACSRPSRSGTPRCSAASTCRCC